MKEGKVRKLVLDVIENWIEEKSQAEE